MPCAMRRVDDATRAETSKVVERGALRAGALRAPRATARASVLRDAADSIYKAALMGGITWT